MFALEIGMYIYVFQRVENQVGGRRRRRIGG
jgi:hypothetical protein